MRTRMLTNDFQNNRIDRIGWGTYLFFAVVNACFLPVIWIFYPETANRSLEEIDIIFAKGAVENISYVKAAKELPFLSDEEVEREALRFGLIDTVERVHQHHNVDPEAQKEAALRQRTSASKDSEKAYDEQTRSGNDSDGVAAADTSTPSKSE